MPLIAEQFGCLLAAQDNPTTGIAGTYGGFGCGLWFALPLLKAGPHELVITGSSGDLAVNVVYHLTLTSVT
ncbi:MAG: hypothetical protein GEV28_24620 [Actinophytocola sp.]|uniref:hypothetical protein n=1 Tax=Actinophytocola sp. TaxID=1872138 RepID=UPI00132157B4|nr:hypothetical protein [Actinophytocola sp.]MPZ83402.1 hypothetical protein [Actinophytocola sp.]